MYRIPFFSISTKLFVYIGYGKAFVIAPDFLITKQEPNLVTVLFPITNTGRKKGVKRTFL